MSLNPYLFPRIKEEDDDMDSSYTDNSGQGDLIYNPDTLLWIKRVDEAEMTTDDDSEAKEHQVDVLSSREGYLKTGSTSSISDKEVRRRPRFSASEEFVLVTELLEHYDRLFGERARITPFAQKVLIWQKVLNNVNSVGVVQRGIEEAKKHWHLYRHRLMEKLASVRKHGSGPGHPLFMQLTPLESKVANLFKLEYMLRSPQHVLQSQGSIDKAGEKGVVCVQNGSGTGDPGVGSYGQGDYSYTKAPRNIKFSFDENCALVHEAVGVWDSIIGKDAATTSQARKNFLWSRIVEAVNAAGTQPRSPENCKKRLRDIKRRVKAKMVDQRKYFQRNSSGAPGLELQYLSYEEELMHVIGPDTVRPIDGHVDTDREPRRSEPEDTCDGEDFWNHSSFDMAEEEEEEDDKEMVVKTEPIDYSADAVPPPAQPFPVVVQPVPVTTQLPFPSQLPVLPQHQPVATKSIVDTANPSFVPAKHPQVLTKPPPIATKPVSLPNKPLSFPVKPPPVPHQPPPAANATGNQSNMANAGAFNKVLGSFHSVQHNYHRSQRHQMHVIHMDLLHLGVGLQQLTKNVKVNNHVRSTARSRELRLKQKDMEDQRQYRMEKLCLLRKHQEEKQKLLQNHFERKEKLMRENNQLLKSILQQLSDSSGSLPEGSSQAASQEGTPLSTTMQPVYDREPSPSQTSVRHLPNKSGRTRGGKGRGGT
ncbi:uncharacterized protein LOC120914348 isoform X2 [Rana temporaria]|uniref:uncharacterized protein LOC120914348 isoform X2 n=1 Tax=Rana temporaria TaxID=8407 RepID=UPI001AAD1F12|nr:uncharacterized protein LOC120914348 isoform X2 [Rana temporaria]